MSIEYLGQPCCGRNILAARVVVDPNSGEERFVLSNSNGNGMELIFLDFRCNQAWIFCRQSWF